MHLLLKPSGLISFTKGRDGPFRLRGDPYPMTYPVGLGEVKIENRSLWRQLMSGSMSNKMETTYVGANSVVPDNNSSWFPLKPDLGVRAFLNMVVQEVQDGIFE